MTSAWGFFRDGVRRGGTGRVVWKAGARRGGVGGPLCCLEPIRVNGSICGEGRRAIAFLRLATDGEGGGRRAAAFNLRFATDGGGGGGNAIGDDGVKTGAAYFLRSSWSVELLVRLASGFMGDDSAKGVSGDKENPAMKASVDVLEYKYSECTCCLSGISYTSLRSGLRA